MARKPEDGHAQFDGVYGWMLTREEAARWLTDHTTEWKFANPCFTGSQWRLEALKKGRDVEYPVSALPNWARVGEELRWYRRALVTADGRVTFRTDESAWGRDHPGVLDDARWGLARESGL